MNKEPISCEKIVTWSLKKKSLLETASPSRRCWVTARAMYCSKSTNVQARSFELIFNGNSDMSGSGRVRSTATTLTFSSTSSCRRRASLATKRSLISIKIFEIWKCKTALDHTFIFYLRNFKFLLPLWTFETKSSSMIIYLNVGTRRDIH